MSDEKKLTRLGQAAREFNVATSSIVSLLKKHNIDIIDNINTKITSDICEILLKEFLGDKKVKECAEKLDIGAFSKSKAEHEEIKHPVENHEHGRDVARNVSSTQPVSAPTPLEEKPVEQIKTTIPTPKVIGKIELEPDKAAKKDTPPKKVEPVIEKTKVASVSPEEKAVPKPEHIETVVADLSKNIVVKGTIDLSVFEEKKSKKEKGKKNQKQGKASQDKRKEKAPEKHKEIKSIKKEENTSATSIQPLVVEQKPAVEHIQTKYTKMDAPVVLGKINLESFAKKEQPKKETPAQAQEKDKTHADKKRKRKRIKHHAGKSEDKQKQVVAKVEISDEDIQRQIKETMQRLEPLGKSKTSKRKREKRAQFQSDMHESEMQELQDQKKLKVTEFITANDL
ncbi:MAG: hypothetical protein FWD09_06725, partial [Lentimicrobiaceae bacterium]|nr:hypothetical protein [Lentimicrobiaceae bacterium]